jgi:hypothetical protein
MIEGTMSPWSSPSPPRTQGTEGTSHAKSMAPVETWHQTHGPLSIASEFKAANLFVP